MKNYTYVDSIRGDYLLESITDNGTGYDLTPVRIWIIDRDEDKWGWRRPLYLTQEDRNLRRSRHLFPVAQCWNSIRSALFHCCTPPGMHYPIVTSQIKWQRWTYRDENRLDSQQNTLHLSSFQESSSLQRN